MDNPAVPISSILPQPAIEPEVSAPTESPNRLRPLWLFGGVALLIFGIALGVFSAKFLNQSQSPSQLTLTPSPSQPPTPTPDLYREPAGSAATTTWKTYTNSQHNFSFKYPSDYQMEENPGYVSILSPLLPITGKGYELKNGELKVEIYIQPSPANDTLEAYTKEKKAQAKESVPESKIFEETEIKISGTRAILLKWEAVGTGETRYLIKGGYRIGIAKYPLETSRQTEFDQILSSFKFLGQSDQGTSGKYTGKYFSIDPSADWLFQSDANQSPATPEVLETVSFVYDQARLNVQVGTTPASKVLDSQDGEIRGTVTLDNVVATKKSGYGGIAGSVYSVSIVADYKGRYYLISFYTMEDKLKDKYEDSFNKFLSTFKFL